MARPGIMLYFDILDPIRVLPDEDKGRLLVAMLEYGKDGTAPSFSGMLALAWGFVKPKIDKDEEEYNLSVLRRQYATVCRERKKKGEPEITFDEWLKSQKGCGHQNGSMMTNDDQWYPTTTTTTSTTTSTITTTAAATNTNAKPPEVAAAAAGVKEGVKPFGGTLGKDVVFLTDEQVEDLLERMGLETFNHYVEQLSDFILRQGARPKSHYETIVKWWREDSTFLKPTPAQGR
ncbi:MAG: hypothetical protein J6K89_01570 [Oscillospiraceae bacterium]|nr:hypothetical protein [Oscillospiraceae bacterium]